MRCPKCGNENCNYVATSDTKSTGFKGGNACCGFLLMGPIGLLCGMCGTGSETTNHDYWICNDCGHKFQAGDVSEIANIKFYMENVGLFGDYTPKGVYKNFEEGYAEYIEGSDFARLFIRKNNNDPRITEFRKEWNKTILENSNTLCIMMEGNGIGITDNEIISKEYIIPLRTIQAVNHFKKDVYINQTCINLSSIENAKKLFEFLRRLLPNAKGESFLSYQEILGKLQLLPAEDPSTNYHFSSQMGYEEFVSKVAEKKLNDFSKVNPTAYTRYLQIKERREKQVLASVWMSLIVFALLFIGILLSEGLFVALVLTITIGVVYFIAVLIISSLKIWGRYKTKLLPEKLRAIINEDDQSRTDKKGNILALLK